MSAQRKLVPDGEIRRVLKLAREEGFDFAGIDVGTDYVRLTPPQETGDNLAQWVNRPSHRQKAAEKR